jgi:hypothetical protein
MTYTVVNTVNGQIQSTFKDAGRASDLCIALNQSACRFNLGRAYSVKVG